jgi:hypothetical protein
MFISLRLSPQQHEFFLFEFKLWPKYLAAAVLAVSLGLIASVVRYRRPIASTFAVVATAAILAMIVLPIVIGVVLEIRKAFAGTDPFFVAGIRAAILIFLRNMCIFIIVFSIFAVGGCIAGHVIQELLKRRIASPALPSLITLAIGVLGCAAGLVGTSFVSEQEIREAIVLESQSAYFRSIFDARAREGYSRPPDDFCGCPYYIRSGGDRCGGSSAHDRSGRAFPLCYESEVTPDMIARYRARRLNR